MSLNNLGSLGNADNKFLIKSLSIQASPSYAIMCRETLIKCDDVDYKWPHRTGSLKVTIFF